MHEHKLENGRLYLVCETRGLRVLNKFTQIDTAKLRRCLNGGKTLPKIRKPKEQPKQIPNYIG